MGVLGGGAWLLVMGVSLLTGIFDQTVQAWGGLHPGFAYNWSGLLWIVALHFVGGFIAGYVLAWFYNKFS